MKATCSLVALLAAVTVSPSASGQQVRTEAATPDPHEPFRIAEVFIKRHCSGCHDADSALDLRTAPKPQDRKTWSAILDAVESGQMPLPPEEAEGLWKGPGETPPPLNQELRQELIKVIAAMVSSEEAPPPRTQLLLAPSEWLLIVREVALAFMTDEEVSVLLAPRSDFPLEGRSHMLAADVCSRIADLELRKPNEERKLLRDWPQDNAEPSPAAVKAMVRRMSGLVYQRETSAGEVEQGEARFRRFQRVTGRAREATVALCTSYLTSVQVRLLRFDGMPTPQR